MINWQSIHKIEQSYSWMPGQARHDNVSYSNTSSLKKLESGFSLLEAIVALVILSAGLMAAYSWFDRGLDALIRMEKLALEESVVQETMERIQLQDLDKLKSGSFAWQQYDVRWSSKLHEPTKRGLSSVGSSSFFDISLYQVNLDLSHNGKPIARYAFFVQEDSLERPPLQ